MVEADSSWSQYQLRTHELPQAISGKRWRMNEPEKNSGSRRLAATQQVLSLMTLVLKLLIEVFKH